MTKQPKRRPENVKNVQPGLHESHISGKSVSEKSGFSVRNQLIVLIFLCFVFYGNTIGNGYAFDDTMAIVNNEYVQQGVSGIPKILSSDAYQSYLEHKGGGNQLGGGRYRPLSIVTFAIEQQFMGTEEPGTLQGQLSAAAEQSRDERIAGDMHTRHFINVVLYACAVAAVFLLLLSVLPVSLPYLPFVVSLLFLAHPIHTEVVANVKSRDEILSILFISLTLLHYAAYYRSKDKRNLLLSLCCFFAALLSKEYAVTLVFLLPLFHFVFLDNKLKQYLPTFLPFLVPLGLYLLMRLASVSGPAEGAEKNIMNYPYLYATASQKIATECLVLLQYLKLLVYPHPLLADYSFAQIPYTSFADPLVWLSICIYASGIAAMVALIRRRHFAGFALAFYFANLALVSNFLFNIGAPMGERLVFHSSLGFVLLAGWGIYQLTEKMKSQPARNYVLASILSVVLLGSWVKTTARNKNWENNETLFLHDVQTAGNSVLVNNDAAAACMAEARKNKDTATRNQWFAKAIVYFDVAIKINHGYTLAYLNRGLCYFNSGNPARALQDWDSVRVKNPAQQNLSKYMGIAARFFLSRGVHDAQMGNTELALSEINKALDAAPDFSDAWYNLGLIYAQKNELNDARTALQKALQFNPGHKDAIQMLQRIKQ